MSNKNAPVQPTTTAEHRAHTARVRDDDAGRRRAALQRKLSEPIRAATPRPDTSGLVAEPSPRSKRRKGGKAAPEASDFLSPAFIPIVGPPNGNTGGRATTDPLSCVEIEATPIQGFTGQTIHLDWANFTFPVTVEGWSSGQDPYANLNAVQSLVSEFLGEAPEDRLHGWHGYKCGREWSDKGKIAWSPGRGEAWLSLNADTLSLIPPSKQLELWHALWALEVKRSTRLDSAFDDFARVVSLDTVDAAVGVRNYTGVGRDAYERRQPKNLRKGTLRGDSCNFGLRASEGGEAYLRVYDKKLEMMAKGCPEEQAFDCIRWEIEYADGKATELWKRIVACKTVEEYARCLGAAITNAIDFVDRESVPEASRKNVARMSRLPWWDQICSLLSEGPIIHVKRLISTLCQSVNTFKKQWGKVIALANVALQSAGEGWGIANVIQQWAEKLEPQIAWEKHAGRDLSLSLNLILAT